MTVNVRKVNDMANTAVCPVCNSKNMIAGSMTGVDLDSCWTMLVRCLDCGTVGALNTWKHGVVLAMPLNGSINHADQVKMGVARPIPRRLRKH